jgi:hypothetical protein
VGQFEKALDRINRINRMNRKERGRIKSSIPISSSC